MARPKKHRPLSAPNPSPESATLELNIEPTAVEPATVVEPAPRKPAPAIYDVYVDSKRYWDAKEVNAALREGLKSGSGFILLTLPNAETALTQAHVDSMVAAMRDNPKCAALSASLRGVAPFLAPNGTGKTYRPVPFVPFTTVLIRTEALLSIGLLETRFDFGAGADIDWALRLRSEGFELAVADSVVVTVNDSQADYGRPVAAHSEMAHHVMQHVLNDKWPNGAAKLTAGFTGVDMSWAWQPKKKR